MKLALLRWLSREERADRRRLNMIGVIGPKVFDRGYHLGRAHAFAEAAKWVQTRRVRRQAKQVKGQAGETAT